MDDFFKGGETIRGFAPSGLGPRDPVTGYPLGGKSFWATTAEVRFPLPFVPDDLGFGGAIFADAGSLWGTDASKLASAYLQKHGATCEYCRPSTITLAWSRLRRDPRIGGRELDLEFADGPLRADFGYAILKEAFDQTQVFRFGAATKF